MSCPRRIAVLTALDADALAPGEELWEHARDCPICAAAVAEAQLDALGHGPPDDDALDAIALAALGLGPLPADVELDEEPWLDALASAPAGAEPPMPPPPPSALSRPMAMIPADEMLDPPMPTVSEPIVDRRRWPVWLGGVGTALAAAVMLFTLVPTLREATDDTPIRPAATAPSEPTIGVAPPEKAAKPAPAAAKVAAGEAGDAPDPAGGDDKPASPAADDGKAAADDKAAAEGAAGAAGEAADDDDGAGEREARVDEAPSPRRTRRAVRRRPSAPPGDPVAEPSASPTPEARAAAPKPEPARRAPSRPKKESTSEVDSLLGALDGPGGGSKPAAPAGGEPLLPEQLNRRQILTVVKQHARGIQSCRGRGDPSGNVLVDLVIAPSGRVTKADVVGAHAETPIAGCVERKARAMTFPQFNGPPMQIKMPFAL